MWNYMWCCWRLRWWFHSFFVFFLSCPWQRHEVVLLKELWDMITMVESSMAAWSMTPWREINVEDMELQCKHFAKDLRVLDKEVRKKSRIQLRLIRSGCIWLDRHFQSGLSWEKSSKPSFLPFLTCTSMIKIPCTDSSFSCQVRMWEAFTGLDSKVKNLLISLRAITELQNPAIRDRHWHQLMAATGIHFTMDKVCAYIPDKLYVLHCAVCVCDKLLVPVCSLYFSWKFFNRLFFSKGLFNTVQFLPIMFA